MDTWRLLEPERLAGRFHMAIDDGLARQSPPQPVFRFYFWQPPAISLGYHQSEQNILFDNCQNDGIDVVRRPTGGRAILHAEELTYTVILPRDSRIASGGVHAVHNRISQALAQGLQSAGFDVKLNKEPVDLREHYGHHPGKMACFTAATPYELQIDGKKVVGSAQRQYPDTILQHGSILTGKRHRDIVRYLAESEDNRELLRDEFRNTTTELDDNSGYSINTDKLMHSILLAFASYFHIEWEYDSLSTREREQLFACANEFELFTSKYDSVTAK